LGRRGRRPKEKRANGKSIVREEVNSERGKGSILQNDEEKQNFRKATGRFFMFPERSREEKFKIRRLPQEGTTSQRPIKRTLLSWHKV